MRARASLAAIYLSPGDLGYLESSLRSIHQRVDRVVISTGTHSSPHLDEVLSRVSGLNVPVEILSGKANAPDRGLSDLVDRLRQRNIPWALVVDPHDVYADRDLAHILSFAEQHPEGGQFQVHVQHYWKSPRYRIAPSDPVQRTVLFRLAPNAHTLKTLSVPEELGICHNFSFACPADAVMRNLKGSNLPERALQQWRTHIWEGWSGNRATRNLHPEQPERFRSARRIQIGTLPEALSGHPWLHDEIAGERRAEGPSCSIIVASGEAEASTLGRFVQRLAETAPDDCEIVVSSKTAASLEAIIAVPGVVIVEHTEKDLLRAGAWSSGAQAAQSRNLLFVTTGLSFEGDWIEGFQAALETSSTPAVYLPRLVSPSTNQPVIFEQRRGRFYGQQSRSTEAFNPQTARCWACTRDTFRNLTERTPAFHLEDTVVFSSAGPAVGAVTERAYRSRPRATIVIPVFNNLRLTQQCLESIFRNTPEGLYELVVVDNGSTDESWNYLQSLGKRIRAIHNRRNLFFARGSNRGAWAAQTEHIVFLNNDTIVTAGWLDELLKPLDADASIGMVGNKQIFPDSHPSCPGRVWHAGMVVGENRIPWHVCYGFDPQHPAVTAPRECVAVSGCCFAIRRTLFEDLQGFDPHFQNGFEDVDLCLRARERGYRIVYAPASEIVHFVSSTESRFDRESSNLDKFKARWLDKLIPDERQFLRASGLLADEMAQPKTRIGFISTFGQKGAGSQKAEQLLAAYPQSSYVVLAEFGAQDRPADRRKEPDARYVIRCWDRGGSWYYPLLRWATTLDLDLIHVNFDARLFPIGFLELLQALKDAGKHLVFTFNSKPARSPLLTGIAQLADAIVVESEKDRLTLIRLGVAPWKALVFERPDAQRYWNLYGAVQSGAIRPLVRARWEGPQLVNHSLALVNREIEMALIHHERIDLTITPVGADTFADRLNPRFAILTSHYGRILPRPEVHVRHQWPPNWQPPAEGHWVVVQPWEYGGVPEEWMLAINREVDELWVPSHFVRRLYLESGADPNRVHVVPNGVDTQFFKPGVRPYPLKSARRFKFLFVGGTIHRKGIDLLLDAYCRAFNAADDVSLVIKDTGVADVYQGQGVGERIRKMQATAGLPHIIYLDRDLTDTELVQLYNACDCLAHPYRGEGFALPVLEAMACGLPVVVTAGGATDDFVDDEVGFRIPARPQVFGNRVISGLKTAGDLWLLEPDMDALGQILIHIARNPEEAREVGRRGRERAESNWTWRHAARKAMTRMQVLKTRPVLRHLPQADATVLIDLQDDHGLPQVIESLIRNSYARLAVFLLGRSPVLDDLRRAFPEIEILGDVPFASAVETIRSKVRSPFMAFVTKPCLFSKHWLQQLIEASVAAGSGPSVVVPWLSPIGSSAPDEGAFQLQARKHWRQHRGSRRRAREFSRGCALVNHLCLARGLQTPGGAEDWLRALETSGIPAFVAEDTWIGILPLPGEGNHLKAELQTRELMFGVPPLGGSPPQLLPRGFDQK